MTVQYTDIVLEYPMTHHTHTIPFVDIRPKHALILTLSGYIYMSFSTFVRLNKKVSIHELMVSYPLWQWKSSIVYNYTENVHVHSRIAYLLVNVDVTKCLMKERTSFPSGQE